MYITFYKYCTYVHVVGTMTTCKCPFTGGLHLLYMYGRCPLVDYNVGMIVSTCTNKTVMYIHVRHVAGGSIPQGSPSMYFDIIIDNTCTVVQSVLLIINK